MLPCCRCLAALFARSQGRGIDLTPELNEPALEFCLTCGLSALQYDAEYGTLEAVKAKAGIAKAFSRSLAAVLNPSSNECPVNIQLCEHLLAFLSKWFSRPRRLSSQMLYGSHPVRDAFRLADPSGQLVRFRHRGSLLLCAPETRRTRRA
jgi:hypothetical protein